MKLLEIFFYLVTFALGISIITSVINNEGDLFTFSSVALLFILPIAMEFRYKVKIKEKYEEEQTQKIKWIKKGEI